MVRKNGSGFTLPDWIYEGLPYFYVTIGALSALALRNLIGIVSGLILISAGVVIWNMRRSFRSRASTAARQRDVIQLDDLMPDDKVQALRVVWHPQFAIGHEVIDRQHRKLFALGNDLIAALVANQSKADIDLILDDLARHLHKHFRTEEEVFLGAEGTVNDEHRESHAHLLKRVSELQSNLWTDHLTVAEIIAFIAHDVITEHVAKEALAFRAANAS